MEIKAIIREFLIDIISEYTRIPKESINVNSNLEDYGINSIMIIELTEEIEKRLDVELAKTIFFECISIKELVTYFFDNYSNLFLKSAEILDEEGGIAEGISFTTTTSEESKRIDMDAADDDVAIIGISGLFPNANNLRELWDNLLNGVDCITEIKDEYFEKYKDTLYCKWGGFINDVDKFDPVFFNIMPKDAKKMDPQIRLFLQETWHAVEDAGYSMDALKNRNIGVYVGVMWGLYNNFGIEEMSKGRLEAFDSSYASIANRVSYTFDFKGPSLAIDSMCSASLSALHIACNSIKQGECEAAIVGGVNLNLHLEKYVSICKGKFGSTIGKCQSFGKGGDGYVPGEGIISILIKPLKKAMEDSDHIYGVVKSTAINHGGKTNGYTVPNPMAQKDVIRDAIEKNHIDTRSVSYIEAHGTGTSLGDPIEIESLNAVYGNQKQEKCAIGSIKSNIGHLEAASGLAGIIKVILQMKHKSIVKSLHSKELNPYIDFEKTPFYVPQNLQSWNTEHRKRVAGVSSFGAGGSNAHVLIEEFSEDRTVRDTMENKVFLLSADSKEQLVEYAKEYLEFLKDFQDLYGMTVTLALGRNFFRCRLYFSYKNKEELIEHLNEFVLGNINHVFFMESLKQDELLTEEGMSLDEVGEKWCQGYRINWKKVLNIEIFKKIPLPTYPFRKEQIWFSDTKKSMGLFEILDQMDDISIPINLKNRYLLNDHIVQGEGILPASAFLVLAIGYYEKIMGEKVSYIEEANFYRRFITKEQENSLELTIRKITPRLFFEFVSKREGTKVAEIIVNNHESKEKKLNVDNNGNYLEHEIKKDEIYQQFHKKGIEYKNLFQSIRSLSYNSTDSVAELEVITELECDVMTKKVILLDASLQAALPLQDSKFYLPVKLENIVLYNDILQADEAQATLINDTKEIQNFGIQIYNSGLNEKVLEIENVVFRSQESEQPKLSYYIQRWKPKNILGMVDKISFNENVIFTGFESYIVDDEQSLNTSFVGKTELLTYLINNNDKSNIIYLMQDSGEEKSPFSIFKEMFGLLKQIIQVRRKLNFMFIKEEQNSNDDTLFHALIGFFNSLELEIPNFRYKLLNNFKLKKEGWKEELLLEFNNFEHKQISYINGGRYSREIEEIGLVGKENSYQFSDKGVYVMVGGGKLSEIVMEEVLKNDSSIKFAVIKRKDTIIKKENKSNIQIFRCDIRNYTELEKTVLHIRENYKCIKGIFFTAGMNEDSLFRNKELDSALQILKTKIVGLENFNKLTKSDELEFFIVFSSLASVIGNVGQTDYAYANAYLNYFASRRNQKVKDGECYGYTKSIIWPFITDGGMCLESKYLQKMKVDLGILPLAKNVLKAIFLNLINFKHDNIGIAYGEYSVYHPVIINKLVNRGDDLLSMSGNKKIDITKTSEHVHDLIAKKTDIQVNRIEKDTNLLSYGVDSVTSMEIVEELEKVYGISLPMTLIYDYPTIHQIAECIIKEQSKNSIILQESNEMNTNQIVEEITKNNSQIQSSIPRKDYEVSNCDIAIIGLSGYYPDAENMEELWEILKNGKSIISEIPDIRWNRNEYFSDSKDTGKYYSKWGGFLENYKKFDPDFFHISPSEAEAMDPQERLFLSVAWNCFEDAGYKVSNLSEKKVGVFVGAMWSLYQMFGYENFQKGSNKYSNSILSSIANRVSYQLNLKGPSITLDTMCSSAMTALNLAYQNIVLGECDCCLVGGVNLSLHYYKYLLLCENSFLSTDGKCKSFGKDGDGYVPGEGIGAVLIKPLEKAIRDKDHIYGIIKGISVNHDGFTGGFTVPSPEAQADVIAQALKKSKLKATDVSYIETHGTGTSLGDPIEINGLNKVYGNRELPCAIGSIKSNLGHLESASGMAALSKILLQFKHKSIVPSLHSNELNPYIDWKNQKFIVQQKLEPWENYGKIRTAGLSSFGAGGSNAHIILQEYIEPNIIEIENYDSYVILISAKTEQSLKKWCEKFLKTLTGEHENDFLERVAYTLQTGRESFQFKVAFIVGTIEELMNQITEYLKSDIITYKNFGTEVSELNEFMQEEEAKIFIQELTKKRKMTQITKLWLSNIEIDWSLLYGGNLPRKISLPTYEFNQREYWILGDEKTQSHNGLTNTSDDVLDRISLLLNINVDLRKNEGLKLIDVGFSSIYALKLLNILNEEKNQNIKLQDINYNPERSLAGFVEEIEKLMSSQCLEDSENNEIKRVSEKEEQMLFPPKEEIKVEIQSVFLTGATGNLGSGILYYLLKNTSYKIICLMRGNSIESAKKRLLEVLDCYLEKESDSLDFENRVEIILGDIGHVDLGLDSNTYSEAIEKTDVIIHGAASTNLSGDYQEVAGVNVEGTKRVIDFALDTKNKFIVFMSTHLVLGNMWYENENAYFDENMLEVGQDFKYLGYQKSKIEAEVLIRKAQKQGLKWIVMRMGNIMGRATDGAFPLIKGTCLYYDILKTLVNNKIAVDTDLYFDITPIDYACESIIHLLQRRVVFETYHITNKQPITMNHLYSLMKDCGFDLKIMDEHDYKMAINRMQDKTSIFIELMKYNPIFGKSTKISSFISNEYTMKILNEYKIECPTINQTLIDTYLSYCLQ